MGEIICFTAKETMLQKFILLAKNFLLAEDFRASKL